MKGKPKFKEGQRVKFDFGKEGFFEGNIYIIDKYGTFEDPSDVSYDIMVEPEDSKGKFDTQCLFKHVSEKYVEEL